RRSLRSKRRRAVASLLAMTVETKKKPAVIGDGRLSLARSIFCGFTQRNAYRIGGGIGNGACWRPRGLHDLGGDLADAGRRQADRTRGAGGEVEHASLDEGATVVDRDDDAAAVVGDAQLGAERQRAVGGRHAVLVEALARG